MLTKRAGRGRPPQAAARRAGLEVLADRLERARATALTGRARTQRGPEVVTLTELLVDSAEEVGFERPP
jgi:hypothetical protein